MARKEKPKPTTEPVFYGYLARYDTPAQLIDAASKASAAGYKHIDAYSPFPVEGLSDALRLRGSPMPYIILAGGLAGAVGGYLMQFIGQVIEYPLNVGGKPLHSWPAFIPITFETTILLAALSGILGLFVLTRFPQPFHPVFTVEEFIDRGSQDGFFLGIEAHDRQFDREHTRRFLEGTGAAAISVMEA